MAGMTVRYIVTDVDRTSPSSTAMPGFQWERHSAPDFAGPSHVPLLSLNRADAPGAGAAIPDGQMPVPDAPSRTQFEVKTRSADVKRFQRAGCRFGNVIVTGIEGHRTLIGYPCGNSVELCEPR